MKRGTKVLTIVYDVFVLGVVVLTAYIYCEDVKDVIAHWYE